MLKPHFLGTLAINRFARQTLVNNGGNLDQYISSDIESFRQAAAKSIYETNILSRFPATDLANRQVSGLPYYPYRDDIVLYWNAIRTYVSQFLSVFYATQADLTSDLNTINGGELVNVVTFMIYTASAHHAAVNYPQGDYYSNPLICPATVSRPTPVPGNTNKAYFMEFLPPKQQALVQMNQMMVLEDFVFTRLGRFESDAFSDPRINAAVANFKAALVTIGTRIDARNALLPANLKYNYLHPNLVPQSTNI